MLKQQSQIWHMNCKAFIMRDSAITCADACVIRSNEVIIITSLLAAVKLFWFVSYAWNPRYIVCGLQLTSQAQNMPSAFSVWTLALTGASVTRSYGIRPIRTRVVHSDSGATARSDCRCRRLLRLVRVVNRDRDHRLPAKTRSSGSACSCARNRQPAWRRATYASDAVLHCTEVGWSCERP